MNALFPPAPRSGRPTRAEAELRDARLIEVAAELFMERGYEGTSIDAVAEAARVSKPTVYARYQDKAALFRAVLQRHIRLWLEPMSAAAEAASEPGARNVETALHELSRTLLELSMTHGASGVKRIVAAQSLHFPELARFAYEEGWLRAVRAIANMLAKFSAAGQIEIEDPGIAADLFLNLVLGRSSQAALHGVAIDPDMLERRRKAAVELFLNGVRGR
jgi:AcrR family transcriptional regulator